MYEDAEIERAAFAGAGRVFCIASAGDTALRLAHEHEVTACDINPVQLAYAKRRAEGGPPESGDVERIMGIARCFMPLIGWRKNIVESFLALTDPGEQMAYWTSRLNTRRFRAGFDALMSPRMLRVVYAPPLLSSLPESPGELFRKRLERGFGLHPNASNPYARSLLLGEQRNGFRPQRAKIRFVERDAATWLESCPPRSFDAFSLSNILDGADATYRDRLAKAIRHAASQEAVVVLRSFADPLPEVSTNHAARDRSMLWGIVDIRKAEAF